MVWESSRDILALEELYLGLNERYLAHERFEYVASARDSLSLSETMERRLPTFIEENKKNSLGNKASLIDFILDDLARAESLVLKYESMDEP
jgi:hypothetical protein